MYSEGLKLEFQLVRVWGRKHFMQLHTMTYLTKRPKILRFFAAGFTSMGSALCHWATVASTTKPMFAPLFGPCKGKDKIYLEMKKKGRMQCEM